MAKSNLAMRFVTAGIGIPLILGLLYFGPPWGWFLFICAAAGVGGYELFGMTHQGDAIARAAGIALIWTTMAVLWFVGTDPRALVTLILLVPLAGQMLVLWRLGDMKTAALRVTTNSFAPLYVGGGMATLALVRRDAGIDGPGWVVLALGLSWLSDTGAYFAGRFLGKHKLYKAVSPKKTVEGALGGLGGALVAVLLGHFFFLQSLSLAHGVVLALVAGALGQAGDLGESLLKRSVDVKDSGGIVPGHGGILDRVDALMVTSTCCYLYVVWH